MSTLNLLYQKRYAVSDSIHVVIPTVGQILENEDEYYTTLQIFTAQPIDYMVQLDDAGFDFTKVNEWDLFLMLFRSVSERGTGLFLEGVTLSDFEMMEDTKNGQIVLADPHTGAVIDRKTLRRVATVLRKIHNLEENHRRPGNEEAKRYMLERARIKAKRKARRAENSWLETMIVAMVNTEQYKYNFETTLDLTIYQFNESVRQVIKKIDYDNRMHGIYAGTINPKELSRDDLNWLVHK